MHSFLFASFCVLFVTPSGAPSGVPTVHGCVDHSTRSYPFCDSKLPISSRVADLMSRLTVEEMVLQLSPTPGLCNDCCIVTPAISRLGIPEYRWLVEVNSAANVGCIAPGHCPTVFSGPTGLAGSFNRTLWTAKGTVVSTELRAANNLEPPVSGVPVGLTGFGPNINMVKDPRYGRNSELPGEDPYLTAEYAKAYLAGLQPRDAAGAVKMLAYLKHFSMYTVETNRMTFTAPVTAFDLWDSYLPAFHAALTSGAAPAAGTMCSYFGPNGTSMCGNHELLTGVVRDLWGRSDAVHESDCSAVANMLHNGNAKTPEEAAAKALNAGLDLYGGWNDDFWADGSLMKAIKSNLTTVAAVRAAFVRTQSQLFLAGRYDPFADTPWRAYGIESMNSSSSQAIAYDAALQAMVLLKNDGILPLRISAGLSVSVVGPMGPEHNLLSDYAPTGICPSGSLDCIETICDAVTAVAGTKTTCSAGVDLDSKDRSRMAAAVAAAKAADVVILALGITKDQEHEGIDRPNTLLPGLQVPFAESILALGKPTVLVLSSGGTLSFDSLIDKSNAIVDVFNPGPSGARALAAQLFGLENRWGKLPSTIYPGNYTSQIQLQDMSFTSGPGRSYRYYKGTPLFSFGHGLSLTNFSLSCVPANNSPTRLSVDLSLASACAVATGRGPSGGIRVAASKEVKLCRSTPSTLQFQCYVANTGALAGDEVVLVYHSAAGADHGASKAPVANKKLIQFDRVHIEARRKVSLTFTVPYGDLHSTGAWGDPVVYPGTHKIIFSIGRGQDIELPVTVHA